MKHLDVAVVEKKIATKTKEWPGNCYAIACMMLDAGLVPGAISRYGHWLGPVATYTMFSGKPIINHGWLELTDEKLSPKGPIIIDPTRWVFEGKDPYIYQGPDFEGYYDVGGNVMRQRLRDIIPAPENDPEDRQIEIPQGRTGDMIRYILEGYQGDTASIQQLNHVANQSPRIFVEECMSDIYTFLKAEGLKALVPLDNWKLVMEG